MRIVCQQTILLKYHALFVIFEKAANFLIVGLQQMTNFETSFPIFDKNKLWHYMRIVCQQTILTKYHALFVFFENAANF